MPKSSKSKGGRKKREPPPSSRQPPMFLALPVTDSGSMPNPDEVTRQLVAYCSNHSVGGSDAHRRLEVLGHGRPSWTTQLSVRQLASAKTLTESLAKAKHGSVEEGEASLKTALRLLGNVLRARCEIRSRVAPDLQKDRDHRDVESQAHLDAEYWAKDRHKVLRLDPSSRRLLLTNPSTTGAAELGDIAAALQSWWKQRDADPRQGPNPPVVIFPVGSLQGAPYSRGEAVDRQGRTWVLSVAESDSGTMPTMASVVECLVNYGDSHLRKVHGSLYAPSEAGKTLKELARGFANWVHVPGPVERKQALEAISTLRSAMFDSHTHLDLDDLRLAKSVTKVLEHLLVPSKCEVLQTSTLSKASEPDTEEEWSEMYSTGHVLRLEADPSAVSLIVPSVSDLSTALHEIPDKVSSWSLDPTSGRSAAAPGSTMAVRTRRDIERPDDSYASSSRVVIVTRGSTIPNINDDATMTNAEE